MTIVPDPEIVITGLGVVSPIGCGLEPVWAALQSNRSGIERRPGFADVDQPWAIAAAVKDFEGKDYIPRKSLKVMCREIQMGFAAAVMAIQQAHMAAGAIAPSRIATVFGGQPFFANPEDLVEVFRQCIVLGNDTAAWGEIAMKQIEPLWMLKYLPNMVSSHVSILLDAQGPSNSLVLGDNSSLPAMIEGVELLCRGWADMAVVGATGSQMAPTATVYHERQRLSPSVTNPAEAVRPFDVARDGTAYGEGAAALVLETRASAEARGVPILARVLASDRAFATSPDQLPARLAHSLRATLSRAGMQASDIGHVNANGTGVPWEDRFEAQGIAQVLPDCPVFAPKSYFGVLGPATGAVESICSLLSLQHGVLPATLNYCTPDPDCPVNVVAHNQAIEKRTAILTNQNSTGQIACMLISAEDV